MYKFFLSKKNAKVIYGNNVPSFILIDEPIKMPLRDRIYDFITRPIWRLKLWFHRVLVNTLGICYGAEGPCFNIGYRYRQNTAYHEEEMNWTYLCPKCQEINYEHWEDMWSDYWSGRL